MSTRVFILKSETFHTIHSHQRLIFRLRSTYWAYLGTVRGNQTWGEHERLPLRSIIAAYFYHRLSDANLLIPQMLCSSSYSCRIHQVTFGSAPVFQRFSLHRNQIGTLKKQGFKWAKMARTLRKSEVWEINSKSGRHNHFPEYISEIRRVIYSDCLDPSKIISHSFRVGEYSERKSLQNKTQNIKLQTQITGSLVLPRAHLHPAPIMVVKEAVMIVSKQ